MRLEIFWMFFFSREDGKDSLKFYTDPGYFVELWCMEMLAADKHAKRPKQRHKDAVRLLKIMFYFRIDYNKSWNFEFQWIAHW